MFLSLQCLILSSGTHFLSGCLLHSNLLPTWQSRVSNSWIWESTISRQSLGLPNHTVSWLCLGGAKVELVHYMWNSSHLLMSTVFRKQIEYRAIREILGEENSQKLSKKQVKSKHAFHCLKINTKLMLVLLSSTMYISICMSILNVRIITYL